MEFKNLRVKDIPVIAKFKTKNAKWNVESSNHYTIQVKLHGKAIHDFGDRKIVITENVIAFINNQEPQTVEIFASNNEISSYNMNFTTYEPIETPSFAVKMNNISEVLGLFDKIDKQRALDSNGDAEILSNFYKLCAIYEKMRQKEYSPHDTRITDSREYIDLNFRDKNCIENAVKTIRISRRRFNELFKKQYNVTPNRYLISKKVEYASQLLRIKDMPISEVSELCGFGDIYYFSKVFKQEMGYTPGNYRKEFS